MASSSSEWLCDTDSLLGEWLSLHPDVLKPDKIDVIGSGDGIAIVDMQKDFIPVDPLSNPMAGGSASQKATTARRTLSN